MSNADLGRQGEDAAARWYQRRGFSVVARNFRTRMGELDLVAARKDLVVVVEVKTRSRDAGFGTPGEAVDRYKQQRVIRAALYKTLPPEVGGFDLVFVARGRTPWCKSTQLEPVVRQLLAQAGLPSC